MSHTSIFSNSRRPKQARSKRASLQGFRDRMRCRPSLSVVACEGTLGLRSLLLLPFTGSTLQRTQPHRTTGSEFHYNRPTVASRYGVIFILVSSVLTQVKSIWPNPSGHALTRPVSILVYGDATLVKHDCYRLRRHKDMFAGSANKIAQNLGDCQRSGIWDLGVTTGVHRRSAMKSVSAGSLWAGHWPSPAVAFLTYNYIRCVLFSPGA